MLELGVRIDYRGSMIIEMRKGGISRLMPKGRKERVNTTGGQSDIIYEYAWLCGTMQQCPELAYTSICLLLPIPFPVPAYECSCNVHNDD